MNHDIIAGFKKHQNSQTASPGPGWQILETGIRYKSWDQPVLDMFWRNRYAQAREPVFSTS